MDQLKPTKQISSPLTPLMFLQRAATVFANSPSLVYTTTTTTTFTWSETYRRCLSVASSISNLGIRSPHVVSVLAPNVPAMYELQFAIPMAGAVLNNLNIRLDARTISVILQHSESKLVFVDSHFISLILESISLFPTDIFRPILVLIGSQRETSGSRDFHGDYEEFVRKGDPDFKWVRPENEWEPMVLNYTSGTTSSPKGVVQSHRSMYTITVDCLMDWSVPKQPVFLWTVPMFHCNGWTFTWGMAAVGGTNICLRSVDVKMVYAAIRQHQVTHMCGAPVVLNMLLNSPDVARPLDKPVEFFTGDAPPPAAILHRAESLGFLIHHGYGLMELGGVVVTCAWKTEWDGLPATERAKLKARQGVGIVGITETDVMDPKSGKSVKRDGMTTGEIVMRGGSMMLGYLKDPAATAKCIREDGWLYTGDVGVMHPDGYLEIKDRSKDVIISGGENVSSVEVEAVLYLNPAVGEAAVVARPDEFWGETPCAFVSLKDVEEKEKRPTEKEIIEFCRERLPHYMVPNTVVFMDELPKTATGKIQKYLLRNIANDMGSLPKSRM